MLILIRLELRHIIVEITIFTDWSVSLTSKNWSTDIDT